MLNPVIYTFDNVPQPDDRLAKKSITSVQPFTGTAVFPITIDSMTADLYLVNEPNEYLHENRYTKVLPELLQTYPNTITTSISGNKLYFTFDPRIISAVTGQFYVLEFYVYDGIAHFSGKVLIKIEATNA